MSINKILILIIVAVAALGAGGVLFLLFLTPQSPLPILQRPAPTTTTPNQNTQTTITLPGGTTGGVVDIAAEQTKLFSGLSATRLQFTRVDSQSGPLGDVYALYAEDGEAYKTYRPDMQSFPLHIAAVDLNSDGILEAIVYADPPGYCGTGGCPLSVYKKEAGVWVRVLDTVAQEAVGLSKKKTEGYTDLFITMSGSSTYYKSHVKVYVWDGEAYQPSTDVAVWTGTTFEIK